MSRRFDSFLRASLTSTGTCAQTGGASPKADHSNCCFGVLDRCSSARTTWVIPISMSSTTLASTNNGEPLPRNSTKSSRCSCSNVTAPRITSSITVSPSGTRKRNTRPGPGPSCRSREKPSYPGFPRALARVLDLFGSEVAVVGADPARRVARRRRRGRRRRSSGSTAPRTRDPRRRYRARRARRRCPGSTPGGCAPRRCPRSAARTSRRAVSPAPSCTAPCAPRRRGRSPVGEGAKR